eukprot:COSAG02_NODE_50000_length_323_cov_0.915179_1_plen_70_part_01
MVVCGPLVEMMHLALRSLSRWLNGRTRTATRMLSPDIPTQAAPQRTASTHLQLAHRLLNRSALLLLTVDH